MRVVTFQKRLIKNILLGVILTCLTSVNIFAQTGEKDKGKVSSNIKFIKETGTSIKAERVDWPRNLSPVSHGSGYPERKDDKWIAISAEFLTEKEMTEEVKIVVSVEAYDTLVTEGEKSGTLEKNPDGAKFVVLKGETVFQNLYPGKHLVTMYLHPSMVKRYGGASKKSKDFTKTNNIRFEAFDKSGEAAEFIDRNPDDPTWTTSGTVVEKAVLSVVDTPWWPVDAPKYEQIKKQQP